MKNEFLKEASMPLAKRVGNTLSSVWTIVFGNIDIYAEKKDFERQLNLQEFKEQLEQKVSSIPEEKIVEPPLHILGPTLESAKYYFENDELRSMFANLIATSINIDQAANAHPAFVEIIKQLHPDEAKIIRYISDGTFPLLDVYAAYDDQGILPIIKNFSDLAERTDCVNPSSISSYLNNLSRLGLISIENSRLVDLEQYDSLMEHPVIKEAQSRATLMGSIAPKISKKHFRVTAFGHQFYRTCCVEYRYTRISQVEI